MPRTSCGAPMAFGCSRDGWGWIFTAVEHWNAECVGWHVCKRGDRFAALQPISMGLAGLYGSTAAGAARGLALRMDHGSQYLSDHFTNQIKFWGIQPSYAFVAEPQTNGVAERFNRTLKEQIIHVASIAGRRPRLRRRVDRRKERLKATGDLNQARRVDKLVSEPGALHILRCQKYGVSVKNSVDGLDDGAYWRPVSNFIGRRTGKILLDITLNYNVFT